jgi:hypothetical protein
MTFPFRITEADFGRYVRHKPSGAVGRVQCDQETQNLYPDIHGHSWVWVPDDFEYVTVETAQ